MNILLYARVSTEDQTLEPQWLELREHAARMGWKVVGEYSDVLSGARAERPGLHSLLAHCGRDNHPQAVLVVKLDRLGRSLLNVVGLVEALTKMGVGLICSSQGIDTREDNPCGRMMLSVLAAVAEFERDIIRSRTRAGLKAARARGSVLGRVSPVAPDAAGRAAVVAAWRAETGGRGLRDLARRMGGVSVSTAAALARQYPAVMEVEG